jgi:hypothetical protein
MKWVNREGWVFLSEVASSTDSARMNTNGKYRVYFFRMFGMCEHALANEVVRNTLHEQTEQCTRFWGGAEGIKMAEPTIFFFYIEFVYTLLIFLKLRNTKEMRKFCRGEEGLCKLWIQSPIVYKSIIVVQIWFMGEHRSCLAWSSISLPLYSIDF